MRVLFVAHRLNLSGASIHNATLGRGLVERGAEVGIVARDIARGTPHGEEYFRNAGFWVREIGMPSSNLAGMVRSASYRRRAVAAIKEFKPTIIHVQAPTLAPFFSRCVKGMSIPVVSTFNIEAIGSAKAAVAAMLNRFIPGILGEKIFAVSSELRQMLIDQVKFYPDQVVTIPCSINTQKFRFPTEEEKQAARKEFGLSPSGKVVCVAAVLEDRKGHRFALQAMKELVGEGLDLTLLCAGADRGNESRLREMVRELALEEHVKFLGHVDPAPLYWASDISLLPSLQEGFGLVILESMLSGCIAIRTPTAGCNDQINDGETGFVVESGSASSIAHVLRNVLKQEERWESIRSFARAHAMANFSVGKLVDVTLSNYRKLI